MSENKFLPALTFRPATPTDEPSLLALLPYLADFSIPPQRHPQHLWQGDAAMAQAVLSGQADSSFIDVAEDSGNQIIGLIMVSLRAELLSCEPSAHLEAIVVAPQARGLGLGSKLMTHCEQRVRDLGARSLTLHVFARNQRARGLYAAQGFDEELLRAIKWLD